VIHVSDEPGARARLVTHLAETLAELPEFGALPYREPELRRLMVADKLVTEIERWSEIAAVIDQIASDKNTPRL
jgi:hypothetical protein